MQKTLPLAAMLVLLGVACATPEELEQARKERREEDKREMFAIYPLGSTLSQVRVKIGTPTESHLRPASGWTAATTQWIREAALESEQLTGHSPARLDYYETLTHGFLGLCSALFYYDEKTRLLDVDRFDCGD